MLLTALAHALPPASVLERCGDVSRCNALYRAILVRATQALENGAANFGSRLDSELLSLPDPERALVHLDRLLEAAFNPASLLDSLMKHPRLPGELLRLLVASVWCTDALVRDAGLIRWLLLEADTNERDATAMEQEARQSLSRFDTANGRMQALRRFQRRELLRIAAGDLLGRREIESVMRELSALADLIVQLAWEQAMETAQRRFNVSPTCGVAIIALGKLGGRELNYSSDIDLMIVYDSHTALGAASTHDVAVAAVVELVRNLSEVTPEGQLYRTDLRLRPDGSAGPPALSLQATLSYYETRGADWERQMLLRARVCAGDRDLGNALLRGLVPFIYPRSLRRLPSELFAEVIARLRERWSGDLDVKHMRGGIRHIEFALQALQRIHGASDVSVRTPSTLQSLDALMSGGYLTPEEHALLRRAYVFLRRIEHMIQLDRFEQTHLLPSDPEARARIAWMLGCETVTDFDRRLDLAREDVARICGALAAGPDQKPEQPADADVSPFTDVVKARQYLRDIVDGRSSRPRSANHRERLHAIQPDLLTGISAELLPDVCLASLEHLLHRSPATGEIVGLLEQPRSRGVLLRLSSLAPVQLRALDADPLALELVLGGWDHHLDDARLKHVAETSALAEFLTGAIAVGEYGSRLTDTADSILARRLEHSDNAERLIVLAMGKYGNRELVPGSDLDIVFIHDRSGENGNEAQLAAAEVVRGLQDAGYAVDARLRPEGGSAPLSISIAAWKTYLRDRASLWEKQSLLRARIAGGNPELAARADAIIDEVLDGIALTADDVRAIDTMRRRMEPENRFRRSDFIDIKRSAGGLIDVEFAWQVLCLAMEAGRRSAVRGKAVGAGSVPDILVPVFARMLGHYERLCVLQLRLRLLADTPSNLFPADLAQQNILAKAALYPGALEYLNALRQAMHQARIDYDAVLAHVAAATA